MAEITKQIIDASQEVVNELLPKAEEAALKIDPSKDLSGQTFTPEGGLRHAHSSLISQLDIAARVGSEELTLHKSQLVVDLAVADILHADPARRTEQDFSHPTEKIAFQWRKNMLERLAVILK